MDDEDPQTNPPPEPEDTPSDVGYRRPPREHRFPPGKSGNPRGRPKKSRNFKTEVADVLNTPIGVAGQKRPVSLKKAVFLRQAQRALKDGDPRAAKTVLDEAHALDDREAARAAEAQAAAVAAEDEALIAAALARLAPKAEKR
jgi:hypothetical protein